MNLVKNYQHMMDRRLSKPKECVEVLGVRGSKVYKNSFAEMQEEH